MTSLAFSLLAPVNSLPFDLLLCCSHLWSRAERSGVQLSFCNDPRGGSRSGNGDLQFKKLTEGFPGGSVVESACQSKWHGVGSPGSGKFHMPRGSRACQPQLLSLWSRTGSRNCWSLSALEPVLPRGWDRRSERPGHWLEGGPLSASPHLEKNLRSSNKDPCNQG